MSWGSFAAGGHESVLAPLLGMVGRLRARPAGPPCWSSVRVASPRSVESLGRQSWFRSGRGAVLGSCGISFLEAELAGAGPWRVIEIGGGHHSIVPGAKHAAALYGRERAKSPMP